jgi:hypothetical protein
VQPLGYEPAGQAAAAVLGQGSNRADESNWLRAGVVGIRLDLAQRDGSWFAGRGHDGQAARKTSP